VNAKVSLNSDGTNSVRVGRAVEHVETDGRTKAQVFDGVKWALISKDVRLPDVAIAELLQRAGA
jgi:hypothetical protein